ncbi:hypothetical protein Tco_0908693 [Tanacetum coccineum]|uniref:Uncharacterized protein n=1 Tax=Tanacetum coccineum TaxID=301880 RepID=A0ABQ5CNK0_9ASTR
MIEPEVPLKRKDQIALDEQIARDIQAKLDAELLEEQKLAREQEKEANIALIESWENTQAMMEADRLLAERLQSKEREELTNEEKAKLFMELMEKRRKHFAALRAQEKRNRPPTKAQKRTQMSTYLKHMAMGSEVQESKEKKEECREETTKGSRKKILGRKRAGKEQQKESSKKQKVEEEKESEEVDKVDEAELKKLLVIKKDEDIAIDAIPLATKLPEDASKQGRRIEDIDADAEVTLVNETQERQDEDLMFDTGVLDGDEMFVDATTGEKDEQITKLDDSTAGEAFTTVGVEDSTLPTIPTTVSKPTVFVTQPSIKEKGKGIMQEPERPLTKKDQVALDEDFASNIQAQLNAKIIEEETMMEADRLLVERLQTREREELTNEEKGKLFMKLMEKRRKHFTALRAQEKRNRPPANAQKRSQMYTYLKHIGRYKHKQLMGKSNDEIQKLFDKEMKRVNTFVAMSSEAQESNEKKVEGSEEKAKSSKKKSLGKKRAVKEQQQESPKRQKLGDKETDEHEEVEADDTAELKKHLVNKKDDDIAIDVIPLITKPPVIVDYNLLKEGIMVHYQLIRADGSSKRHSLMIRLLQGIDRRFVDSLELMVKTANVVNKGLECIPPEFLMRLLMKKLKDSENIKFRGGLLGLKELQGFLLLISIEFLLSVEVSTTGTYYCLCSVCAAGYKDTTAAELQLLEDLLLSRG